MVLASAGFVFTVLGFYIVGMGLCLYTMICGSSERHEHDIIGKGNRFLNNTIPSFLRYMTSRTCGIESTDKAGIFFEKYIMPIGYHSLLLLGLVVGRMILISRISELQMFTSKHYGLCPRSRLLCISLPMKLGIVSFPPSANNWTVYLYGFVAVISWGLVFFTNPGTITQKTSSKLSNLYQFDHFTFRSGRDPCTTCGTPRLARSKHCNLCGFCVARFDHHCGWVGTCVGLYNTRYFLTFLFVHTIILFHAFGIGSEILVESVARLVDGGYVMADSNEPILKFSLKVAFLVEPQVFFVTFAYLVTSIMVSGFFIYHLTLVWRNITTNETFKWDNLRSACADVQRERGAETLKELFEEDRRDNGVTRIPDFGSGDFPINIYNRGVIENFAEVLFPHRFLRLQNKKNSKHS